VFSKKCVKRNIIASNEKSIFTSVSYPTCISATLRTMVGTPQPEVVAYYIVAVYLHRRMYLDIF
jgi:hypothetical protein